MEVKKVKKCEYNPRSMGKNARQALKASIDEFDDIAGITIDANDGTLICGNHRFDEICRKYGRDSLSLRQVVGEFHAIYSGEIFINYIARIVDWPEEKVKSANISANSSLMTGEFTSRLQEQLASVSKNVSGDLFKSLRLNDLQVDLSIDASLSLDLDGAREHAEMANKLLDDAKNDEPEPVTEVVSIVKVSVPEDLRDTVKDDLLEFLSKKDYYNRISLV